MKACRGHSRLAKGDFILYEHVMLSRTLGKHYERALYFPFPTFHLTRGVALNRLAYTPTAQNGPNDDCEACFCLHQKEQQKRSRRDGEREDRDQEDRQLDQQASDVFKAEERIAEEGEGAGDTVRRRSRSHDLLKHRQALRLWQHQVLL
ncbi:hypothetical protein F0562_035744 [Nyssa sinensis]|uniref:Uncharacterized protein n=1 Tax=Nyssa sinensis TaxID=561372 RepID=A0A5J5ADS2_9ASTE|nr:hypothetical protein F0562_035744 [Nyssa sinensis]